MKRHAIKLTVMLVLIIVIGLLIVPLFDRTEVEFVERIVMVETMQISESSFEESYRTVAFITPKRISQATFQSIGTISEIYVAQGDRVVVNQILARMNDEQAQLQLRNAREALSNAQFNLRSAQLTAASERRLLDDAIAAQDAQLQAQADAVTEARQNADAAQRQYENDVALHGENAVITQNSRIAANVAQAEYQRVLLAYETAINRGESNEVFVARTRFNAAQTNVNANTTQVNIAQNNVTQAENNLENTILRASMSGIVIRVVGNVNDLATPLAPVVVIASDNLSAVFGVPFQWLSAISLQQQVVVFNAHQRVDATISSIAPIPDQASRTFEVAIDLEADSFPLGSSVSIEIQLDEVLGVWIPISSILNDGKPYVFLKQDNRAVKRRIEILSFNNTAVRVEGLTASDVVIINGIKTLRSGTAVQVINP